MTHRMAVLAASILSIVALAIAGCTETKVSHQTVPATITGGATLAASVSQTTVSATQTVATPAPSPTPSPTPTPLVAIALAASDVLAGDAAPPLPVGDAATVSVVLIGTYAANYGSTIVPIIIRNNTNAAVSHVEVSAGAKDANGNIVGSGKSQGFHPATLQPGEASMGFVYFSSDIPAGAAFDFTFETMEPSTSLFAYADLNVTQANALGTHIAGGATNQTGKTIEGPISVGGMCFDDSGAILSELNDYADGPSELAPGSTVTFDISLYNQPCPHFLLGASGYYK